MYFPYVKMLGEKQISRIINIVYQEMTDKVYDKCVEIAD